MMVQAVPALAQISTAVHVLASAGRFERFVGQILRLAWPERFAALRDAGTNLDERTKPGWPDLVAFRADGTIDAVEVTYGVKNWERHLSEDVLKFDRYPKNAFASFTFVSWSSRPETPQLISYLEQLDDAGLSPGRVRFLFREDIVEMLTNPKFARLWQEPLKLRASPWPFQIIQEVNALFGSDRSPERFKPTRDDFLNGRVHLPPLLEPLKATLMEKRVAVLRGRGASGKTVFATALAYEPEFIDYPVYYLDLEAPGGTIADACEAMTMFGSEDTLFIIDNAHLDLRYAEQLHQHARYKAAASRLLITRRHTSALVADGSEESLSQLHDATYDLEVGMTEIAGVYRRLMERFYSTAAPPPPEALNDWNMSFSGDLAVFSAAVVNRIAALYRQDWRLDYDAAAELIQNRYLRRTSPADQSELALLALASHYEAALPWSPSDHELPDEFIKSGIVDVVRSGEHIRRRFAHPSVAALVLSVLGPEHLEASLPEVVRRSPLVAVHIAGRAMAATDDDRVPGERVASKLLNMIASVPEAFDEAIANLPAISELALLYRAAGVLGFSDFDEKLLEHYDTIRSVITTGRGPTPLSTLIEFAARHLPAFHKRVFSSFRDDDFTDAVLAKFLARSLEALPRLLKVLQNGDMKIWYRVCCRLSLHEEAAIVAVVNATPEASTAFLQTLREILPDMYEGVRTRIATDPERLNAFVQKMAGARIDQPSVILSFLHQYDKDLYRRAVIRLFRNFRHQIASNVTQTPLPQLSLAFGFMYEHLRQFHDSIIDIIMKPEYTNELVTRVRSVSLGDVASFIEQHPPGLDAIAKLILDDLGHTDRMEELVSRVSRAPLHDSRAFIAMAGRYIPRVASELIERLTKPNVLDNIAKSIAANPSEHLIGFARTLEPHDRAISGKLLSRLCSETLLSLLARRLLDAPLHAVSQVLQFFGREDIRHGHAVIRAIAAAAPQVTATRTFYRANTLHWLLAQRPIDGQPPLEKYRQMARELRGSPKMFISVARALEGVLPDLARHIASLAMIAIRPTEWRRGNLELLLHAVRLSLFVPRSTRRNLFVQAARLEWLDQQYERAEPFYLARMTFLLWIVLDYQERAFAVTETLRRTLNSAFAAVLNDPKIAIPLMASAKLLHLPLGIESGDWNSNSHINAAIVEMLDEDAERQTEISFRTAAFWIGLKAMAAMRRRLRIVIEPALGNETLRRWRRAIPDTDRVERMNAVMNQWLESCAANGWQLIHDSVPFDA